MNIVKTHFFNKQVKQLFKKYINVKVDVSSFEDSFGLENEFGSLNEEIPQLEAQIVQLQAEKAELQAEYESLGGTATR